VARVRPVLDWIDQDWGTLTSELGRLMADARDVLDATQFLTGTGTDAPAGVLTGLRPRSASRAPRPASAVADHYSLKGPVPARFLANRTWVAHTSQWDRSYRLTPSDPRPSRRC
jgi:hypothetical protein